MNKTQNNTGQEKPVESPNYLVTEAVDPSSLGDEKLNSDLSMLTKAEEKQQHKPDISRGIENPHIQRAASSLRLKNPFKGY